MAENVTRIIVAGTLIVGCSMLAFADDSDGGAQCAVTAAMPDHIRTTTCNMRRAVVLGMSDSPTFRGLVERVAALHGIVYLTAKQVVQSHTLRAIDGTLQHRVTVAGSYRILYVTVTPYSGSRPTRIIAHELQHAIEVLESNAGTGREIDDLFDRIGVSVATHTIETEAALAIEATVAKELANQK